jgi:hypothetical protein
VLGAALGLSAKGHVVQLRRWVRGARQALLAKRVVMQHRMRVLFALGQGALSLGSLLPRMLPAPHEFLRESFHAFGRGCSLRLTNS